MARPDSHDKGEKGPRASDSRSKRRGPQGGGEGRKRSDGPPRGKRSGGPSSKGKRSSGPRSGQRRSGHSSKGRRGPREDRSYNSGSDYTYKLVATCALGLEMPLGRELEALGLGPIERDNAQVSFPYTPHNLAKANYWLRTADRVWLQLAEFPCRDFEELFQGVKAIDWPGLLPQDAHFPVEVVSSCQSVAKKAAVEKMQTVYGIATFAETGAPYAIRVFIVYDRARVFIDSSGEGLHRRGYRTYNAKAPLRETVAAALVQLSHWTPNRELYDPMCGSGTILLEAACIGLNKAAGVERPFASQRWPFLGRACWEEVHKEALDLYDRRTQLRIFGSDNDPRVLKLARTHTEQAGLEGRGVFTQNRDVGEFSSKKKYGVMITNPPYGRRLSTEEEVEELTRTLAQVFEPLADTWSLYYYTAFDRFAEVYGREPERVRKIYNGRIPANLLQYPGPKPPNSGGTEPRRKRIPLNP